LEGARARSDRGAPRGAAQEKLESSEAQVRELTERLELLQREKLELEMRSSALAAGAGGAGSAGLLVRARRARPRGAAPRRAPGLAVRGAGARCRTGSLVPLPCRGAGRRRRMCLAAAAAQRAPGGSPRRALGPRASGLQRARGALVMQHSRSGQGERPERGGARRAAGGQRRG